MSRPKCLRVLLALLLATVASLGIATAQASANIPYRGVQLHSLWPSSSYTDMDRELDMSRDVGSNVVRVDLQWSSLETNGPGQWSSWYLDKLDHFVAGAQARGMKVLPNILGTPCWASSAPDTLKQNCSGSWWDRGVTQYLPTNLSYYGNVVKFVVGRYGTKLAALEIWNEPNGSDHNFLTASDYDAAYTQLVKAGYPASKAANPNVPVLAGALSFADRPFLDALYADGIKGYYDGISVHPYNEWRAPGDMWQDQWKKYTLIPGLKWIREGMLAQGDTSPVWITEFGWTSCNPGAGPWCVGEANQAQYLYDSFPLIDQLGFIQSAIVYNLRNKGTDTNDQESQFGLVRQDFSLKPSYNAVKAALGGAAWGSGSTGTTSGDTTSGGTTSGDTTSGDTTSGGTTSGSNGKAKGRKAKTAVVRRLQLRLVRRAGRVVATGRALRTRRVLVRAFRGQRRGTPAMRRWVKVDGQGRFASSLPSGLNRRLLVVANATGATATARLS
jgi:polysaccharide biosynthesis protein PslG